MKPWVLGRQGGSYAKKRLWSFSFLGLGTDGYLIKYEPNYEMPMHKDEAEGRHYRLNIVYRGRGQFICDKVIWRIGRAVYFRPDNNSHGMKNGPTERRVFSVGFLLKPKRKKLR